MKKNILRNQKGALLVETIAAIGILTMLSLLAMPLLQRYRSNLDLNGISKDLTSDLRLAQQLTISEQNIHLIQFDTAAKNYSLLKLSPATTTVKSISLPAGTSYQAIDSNLNNQVRFNSFGGVSQSGKIVLINTLSKTATINIKPSGYVELQQ